jgi:hypothetical protein
MMKKRISILSLTLLFLVSTTGLPVTYHLCEMMGKKSLNECEDCKIEMQKVEKSCCDEYKVQDPITISSENPICCQDEFVFNKVDDDFSQSGNHQTITNSVITILKILILDTEIVEKYSHQNNYSLPPPKFGKQLLQSIHQIKIDPSIC